MLFPFSGPNFSGAGAENLKMLEPEPKKLHARSWSRSLKFEYRLHRPGWKSTIVVLTKIMNL